jgi:hypothetical protein
MDAMLTKAILGFSDGSFPPMLQLADRPKNPVRDASLEN